MRFNPDSTIGTIPWPTGGLNYIEDVTIQPDDKILAVGGFLDSLAVPPVTRHGIARLNVNDSVDTSFHIDPAEFGVPAGAVSVRAQFRQAALDCSGRCWWRVTSSGARPFLFRVFAMSSPGSIPMAR